MIRIDWASIRNKIRRLRDRTQGFRETIQGIGDQIGDMGNMIKRRWKRNFVPLLIVILILIILELPIRLLLPSFHQSVPVLVHILGILILIFLAFEYYLYRLLHQQDKKWGTIAEIAIAFATMVLAVITIEHSIATQKIAEEIARARINEIRPRLKTNVYGEFNLKKDTISFDLLNTGKGKALDVTIGLKHWVTKDGKPEPWHRAYPLRLDRPLLPDSCRKVQLHIDTTFSEVYGVKFKAYILYRDLNDIQYLTIAPVRTDTPTTFIGEDFWNALKEELKRRKYPDTEFKHLSKSFDSVEVYPQK